MSYVQGEDRGQAALLPAAIEDYVTADAAVRVIDAFVDGLNVSELGFGRSVPAPTGRPPYDPRDLLKLYIWGYFNEVRSSRRLERECRRNVEAMWLLRRLSPDFKTIADFRRDNGMAIVGACRAFVMLCRDAGLFTARLIALDGSKFRAVASGKKIVGHTKIAAEAAYLDRKIAAYLNRLDKADTTEPDDRLDAAPAGWQLCRPAVASSTVLPQSSMLKAARQLSRAKRMRGQWARAMGPKPPSYNVQTAVDADTGLIIRHDVTVEPSDNRLLHPMSMATKEMLGQEHLTVVADAGYSSGAHASACERDGIVACVPATRAINNQAGGKLFDRSAFTTRRIRTATACPAGRSLMRKQLHRRKRNVAYMSSDCSGCALKPQCTTAERRFVKRHLDEDALTRMNARAIPEIMARRRCAAEHPFGSIKRMMAGGRFLTRNLKGTRTEMALSVLAYNMLRASNIKAATA
jgi:transposase